VPELSFVAVFLGGVLAILSPCSALLLPAFFAVAFTSRVQLLRAAVLFYAGLATIFVPLGLGVSFLASLFFDHRPLVILAGGALLVGFGLFVLVGGGFAVLPGAAARLSTVRGRYAAYATGLAYGFAGFCTGPILGGVLTVAASAPLPLAGAALLATYALGMTAPVFALALAWDRFRIGERGLLRHAEVRLGAHALPASRLLAGVLFIMLGASFVVFEGSSALSGLYASLGLSDLTQRIEEALLGAR
jgi:cytochrome c biogenesis protein CcdA